MSKHIFYLLFIVTISYPMDAPKQPLYLVAGSNRESRISKDFFPCGPLWKEDKADVSHTKTYKSQATTMDIAGCSFPGAKYILGDARTYDFKDKLIKAAYLERLPTLDDNFLGKCIQNIGKAMESGAVMEVEWHPYTVIKLKQENQNPVLYAEMIKKDPFTVLVSKDTIITALKLVIGKPIKPKYSEDAKKLSREFDELLHFYAKKKVDSLPKLKMRIMKELLIWEPLLKNDDQMVALLAGPSFPLDVFSGAVKYMRFAQKDDKKIGEFEDVVIDGEDYCYRWYDTHLFGTESFCNFMLADAGVLHNQSYAKAFMEENGFKDVGVERTTSKRNNRQNVWIITATKK